MSSLKTYAYYTNDKPHTYIDRLMRIEQYDYEYPCPQYPFSGEDSLERSISRQKAKEKDKPENTSIGFAKRTSLENRYLPTYSRETLATLTQV
jgi:hypothetical protein